MTDRYPDERLKPPGTIAAFPDVIDEADNGETNGRLRRPSADPRSGRQAGVSADVRRTLAPNREGRRIELLVDARAVGERVPHRTDVDYFANAGPGSRSRLGLKLPLPRTPLTVTVF